MVQTLNQVQGDGHSPGRSRRGQCVQWGDSASTGSASVDTVVFFALNFLLLTAVVERLMAVARGNSQRSFKRTSPSLRLVE